MGSYKIKSVLSTMYMGGLFVAMLLESTAGQSTHNFSISISVKDGLENNVSAIQAELANLREEISKLSLKQDEQMKEQQQILNAEISARNERDNALQSLIDVINSKPRFAAEIGPSTPELSDYLPWGDITDFTELIDVGNNFNPKTGRLTINDEDQDGNYILHISAYKNGDDGGEVRIYVYKNTELVHKIHETDAENSLMVNSLFKLHLQKGDVVTLTSMSSDSIYVDSIRAFTFTGYKI